jgi:phenylalanyl-tRNA synthetase alpha chain
VTPKIISLTERRLYLDAGNPIGLVTKTVQDHFTGFDVLQYLSPVVTIEENFDSLLIPKDHVSRSKHDTYYVNKDRLLRCHTSAHQAQGLDSGSRRFVCVADVYRRDAIDSTHYPAFHQCEIVKIMADHEVGTGTNVMKHHPKRLDDCQEHYDEDASAAAVRDLKSSLESYVKLLLGSSLEMRWVPAYFPFTHPSFELEILLRGKWMEILGCGVIEHKLLSNHQVHNQIGWAAGFGLERLAMLRYSIPDIRLFWSLDSGFTSQFRGLDAWEAKTYKSISMYPQCYSDISFWLPGQESQSQDQTFSSNDFYDLVRSVGGDLVEQVDLIDDFLNKSTNRRSHCYRITYRSYEKTLTHAEINSVHQLIGETAADKLKVELRV